MTLPVDQFGNQFREHQGKIAIGRPFLDIRLTTRQLLPALNRLRLATAPHEDHQGRMHRGISPDSINASVSIALCSASQTSMGLTSTPGLLAERVREQGTALPGSGQMKDRTENGRSLVQHGAAPRWPAAVHRCPGRARPSARGSITNFKFVGFKLQLGPGQDFRHPGHMVYGGRPAVMVA